MQNDEMPERIWLSPEGAHLPYQPTMHWEWQEYHRSDLCASGQQVRALEWDEYAPGCFFGKSECGDYSVAPSASAFHEGEIRLSDVEGNFSYFASPEAAKAAAQADYERRILAALTPAPQAMTSEEWRTSPARYASKGLTPAPQPATPTAQEALLQRAVDLIKGDLTGREWKRACNAFVKDALRALKGCA